MFDYEIDQDIYNAAIDSGANNYLAKIVVGQSRLETGDYSSNQVKVNNNLFGFKYSPNSQYSKVGNISPEGDPYAKYDSIGDSIKDYFNRYWQKPSNDNNGTRLNDFNSSLNSLDTLTFATMLKGYGYYTDIGTETDQDSINNYSNGIASKLRKVNIVEFVNQNSTGIIIFIGLSLSAYIYWLYRKKIV
jgi:hypothetical protein